jgi:hypothetical protein
LPATGQFTTPLLEAQVLVADGQDEYHTYRPALDMLTPAQFAEKWRTEHQRQLS